MKHPNITAYEGVENLSSFDEPTFIAYCEGKIFDCVKQVNFLREVINKESYTGNVLEVGSGNSKLLYALERNDLLNYGVGYELSSSRVEFANRFAKYVGSSKVVNLCEDFLEHDTNSESFDLVIGVDIVMQLIAPVAKDNDKKFLDKVYHSLKYGGALILELMDFSDIIKMDELSINKLRLWKEFDSFDPWQYGLDKFTINGDDVIWDKIFISRDRSIDDSVFQNILRHYTFKTIHEKLCAAGFLSVNIHQHKYWETEGDIPKDEYIVSAVK